MESIIGITAGDWLRLLKENNFRIDLPYLHKAAMLTVRSLFNSLHRRRELTLFGAALQQAKLDAPPLFILGHWRSGTTLLHNLMCQDPQFCYPNLFEVYNPHAFLYLEPLIAPKMAAVPAIKRPMDNMEVKFDSPAEDEFALAILSLRSPLLAWPFPRREQYYDRDLTFQDSSQDTIKKWKSSLLFLCKKLTIKYHRPIIFKSPSHTGRIKLLLELFPDAKFIHIHRNPYTVFLSTRKLYDTAVPGSYLQRPNLNSINDGIIRRYKMMYQAFFDQLHLIPQNNYAEVCFEEFESNIVATIATIYQRLNLPGFDALKPKLQAYVDSICGYKKNVHPSLNSHLREKIIHDWRFCFDAWGYEI
ncbi:MAG: sulfotransferase [candidate division KSB1 bacterium]|nr:sulfotransferase [candidate division KSB1 bacterium]MDZ7334921.1 sulfotransferase [candidate division KSB1 bacterium]MDZ7357527.1 sulfotransferase [candidate division KSB1 bacterium]MDZ7399730.1 sulfotransferase [candidate division KSB1 bacterium]